MASSHDDIRSGAVNDRLQLPLRGLRHAELVQRLLKVVEKSLPLGGRDHKRLVRLPHRATGGLLRSCSSRAPSFPLSFHCGHRVLAYATPFVPETPPSMRPNLPAPG